MTTNQELASTAELCIQLARLRRRLPVPARDVPAGQQQKLASEEWQNGRRTPIRMSSLTPDDLRDAVFATCTGGWRVRPLCKRTCPGRADPLEITAKRATDMLIASFNAAIAEGTE